MMQVHQESDRKVVIKRGRLLSKVLKLSTICIKMLVQRLHEKAPGNEGLPDSLSLLQQCWRKQKGRLSPPVSPLNLDDESADYESISCLEPPAVSPRGENQRCRLPSF
jgi:hypothetical protein